VGLAAVLIGWNGYLQDAGIAANLIGIHHAEVFIGVFIGAVTFTGSIIAFLKLSARMPSAPLVLRAATHSTSARSWSSSASRSGS
jgi:NAD/NADP transhydrogenase beta subunit